jgi:glucose-6-phosphate 1-dehydrogenase
VRLRATPQLAAGAHDPGFVRFRCAPASAVEVVAPAFTRRPSEPSVNDGPSDGPRLTRSPLEEMLTDAARGNTARFAHRDQVEDAWRIVSPLLEDESPVFPYEPRSWGPVAVNRATVPAGGWVNPMHRSRATDTTLSQSAQPARR